MTERSAFHEYLLGGAFEATAKKGIAEAIADLIAAGITPVYSSHPHKPIHCKIQRNQTN